MIFINIYTMIITFLPISVYGISRTDNLGTDLYFEVVEPSDINYTFRCREALSLGVKFVSELLISSISSILIKKLLKNIYLIPAKPLVGCSRLQNFFELQGNIALVQRGDCSFVSKIIMAQESGAIGIIVMGNNLEAGDYFVDMRHDLTHRQVLIPAAFLQYRDGYLILNSLERNHLFGARINIPLNLTYEALLKVNRAPGSFWL